MNDLLKGRAPSVVVQQPALPAYRIPVFRLLGERFHSGLLVMYSDVPGLRNADPSGFRAVHSTTIRLFPGLLWDSGQIEAARIARDVVVYSWNIRYLSLVPALLILRVRGVGSVLWGHGFSKRESTVRRWLRDQVTRLASAVLFYGQAGADRFGLRMRCREKVFVAQNALDESAIQAAADEWRSSPDKLARFQEQEDLRGRPVVLFVSRLNADNRLDLLVRAASRMVLSLPRLRVVVIGEGPARSETEALVEELGLREVVRFLGGIYLEADLAPWFLSSNIFCYPANIGLSVLHSFAYGLPVVTSDDLASHNPEIEALEPELNGLLYSAGESEALAEVLSRYLGDTALQTRLQQGALETIQTRHGLEQMVAGLEAAIRFAGGGG